MEDKKIVQLYMNRDEDAIRQTAEKYGTRLREISFRITRDRETSVECENDTYLETWNRIPPAEPKDYFYAFLVRIIRAFSIDRLNSIGYIDSKLIEKAGRDITVRKRVHGFLGGIMVACFVATVVLILTRGSVKCSDEKIRELREEYPICDGNGMLSMAAMPKLETLSNNSENYVCATILEELDESSLSANAGFGKAGDETIVFKNYRICIDRVICGDMELQNQTIVVTINRILPIPKMKNGEKMILPISKREDGKYDLGPGTYYIADGYVLSTFEENINSVYTGKRQRY